MKLFITGATGFVGRNFLEWLIRNQPAVEMVCLVRDVQKAQAQWPKQPVNITWLTGDLLEPSTYRAVIQEAELVFHIAALVRLKNGPEFYRMNTEATECLLNELSSSNHLHRLVALGSISAIDRPLHVPVEGPLTEASVPHPNTDYGKSKLKAEEAVMASGLPYAILRPAYIYGPYPRPNSSMDRLIRDMQSGAKYLQLPYQGRASGIYVDDLSEMMWLAGQHPAAEKETFFVCNPQSARIADVLADLAQLLQVPYQPRMVSAEQLERYRRFLYRMQPDNLLVRILFEDYFYCSSEKWTRLTGHAARYSVRDGMSKTVDWYRQHRVEEARHTS